MIQMKNKKARLDFMEIFLIIVIILFFVSVSFFAIEGSFAVESSTQACKDLGYKELISWNGEDACEKYNGDIVFVKFNCKGLLWNVECSAKQIKVGEVYGVIK